MAPPGSDSTPTVMAAFQQGVVVAEEGLRQIEIAWQNLVSWVKDFLKQVRRELENSDWVDYAYEWWTEEIADTIKKIEGYLAKIEKNVTKMIEYARESIKGSVPVLSLFEAALGWSTKVNDGLSGIAPAKTDNEDVYSWRGPAANLYNDRLTEQGAAVESTLGKVQHTSAWLAEVAATNTVYMVELSDRVAEVLGALVTVICDAGETAAGAVTQVMFTLRDCSQLIGTAVAEFLKHVNSLAKRMAECIKQDNDMQLALNDNSGLTKDKKWPPTVYA